MADEKVTVVDGSGGGGGGAVAMVIAFIALLVVLYVVFGTNLLRSTPDKIDADVKIDTPK
jgi:hypothetical protein